MNLYFSFSYDTSDHYNINTRTHIIRIKNSSLKLLFKSLIPSLTRKPSISVSNDLQSEFNEHNST